jgi:hypothetical protein
MPEREQSRVTLRSAFSWLQGIDNGDLPAVALQVEAGGDTDNASADNDRLPTSGVLLGQEILLLVRVSMSVICPSAQFEIRQTCWKTRSILQIAESR